MTSSPSLPGSEETSPRERRRGRFLPYAIFLLITGVMFVGGITAILYLLFSKYSGVQNIWILFCGAPVILAVFLFLTLFSLYTRYGRPLEQLFETINAVEAGDLSARVPENKSELYSSLFQRFNKMVGELERAEQQRRNLTADIAHELRTPLHIIQGNLEGLLDGVYQPTSEHINNTLDETRLLTRLVNDLQTLSLAETGQLPLHTTRFLIGDLLQDLLSSFAVQASSLGIELKTSGDLHQAITADYDRLNQALSNLITNALRHTSSGGSIFIQTELGSGDKGLVRIRVKDTGSGIPPEELSFVFDRFWRGDKSRTERTHSGLGLAITRQLIHAHGGRIDVESEGIPGRGTMFTIELPQT